MENIIQHHQSRPAFPPRRRRRGDVAQHHDDGGARFGRPRDVVGHGPVCPTCGGCAYLETGACVLCSARAMRARTLGATTAEDDSGEAERT